MFAGLQITPSDIGPPDKLLSAIDDCKTPTSLFNARGWFGLVNQVAWAYAMKSVMQPF